MVSFLFNNFANFSNKECIIHNDKSYTYGELLKKINEYKKEFNHIKQGEVVAIVGGYSIENIALFLTLFANKNIIVLINSEIQSEIIEKAKIAFVDKIITHKNNKFNVKILSNENSNNLIQNLKQNQNSGLILFSSGSLGKPKAIVHNLDNIVQSFEGQKRKRS
ncbi:AMP-binding protein [Campylobacter majalis]|uniref:AMP-binding protein n=1 Tax=Campylobacter majalis TaxID=2790656 RepID=UPI003D696A94